MESKQVKKVEQLSFPREQVQEGSAEGDLRVWHIPQVPMTAFRVPVKNLREASIVLKALAQYDLFQLEHNVKPDFANAQGLERYEVVEEVKGVKTLDWCEFYDEEGRDILELVDEGLV